MVLLVDAGNTRIKWAVINSEEVNAPGDWAHFGVVARTDVGALAAAWQGLKISRVLLSNVAGDALRNELEQALSHALGLTPVPREWFKSTSALAGLRNGYREPAQLGCDRFAAAIGAHMLYPGQSLVIATCGTATTIDGVTAEGVFIGGMILPGLGLMAASLAAKTAQLPLVPEPVEIAQPFADNTADAIVSGCIAAQTGAIERAVSLYRKQYGAARCVLSGGAAVMVVPHLSIECDKIDNLVLIGLQTVASHAEKPC